MTQLKDIQKKARAAHAKIEKLRRDPRYKRVIGKLVAEGLLIHNHIPAVPGPASLADALWVGEKLEARVLELLPAILLKRPGIFRVPDKIPDDLREVLLDLRHGKAEKDFRGIPARGYAQWLPRIGREGKMPSLLKTFRFTQDDLALLERLKKKSDDTEAALIRRALRALEQSLR